MEKIFAHHIESTTLSPLIVRRSLKQYIERFDPNHIYLLQKEVETALSLSNKEVQEIIRDYKQNRFPVYIELNKLIRHAIIRHQNIRSHHTNDILQRAGIGETLPILPSENYPNTTEELKRDIYAYLVRRVEKLHRQNNMRHKTCHLLDRERKRKILQFIDRNTRCTEESYGPERQADHIIRVMTQSLDAHSEYYTADEAQDIRMHLQKELVGIGVVICEDFEGMYIAGMIEKSPAKLSGKIDLNDRIVAIDGHSVSDMSMNQVRRLMQGNRGTILTLQIQKEREATKYTIPLVREKIVLEESRVSLSVEPFADGIIGKIDIPSFYEGSDRDSAAQDIQSALQSLRDRGKSYGLILDLRNNKGGFLTQAVKVSSLFLTGGTVLISEYAGGKIGCMEDRDCRRYYEGPLVILLSKQSASAAEIVSGTLQDLGVALIVGDKRSYGKGSLQYQTITEPSASEFFKVTIGRYYTASGRSPQLEGIKADIHVPSALCHTRIGEQYLPFPLPGKPLSNELFHSLQHETSAPYLHPLDTKLRRCLPQLKENSRKRLDSNKNFLCFMRILHNGTAKKPIRTLREQTLSNFGSEDLQMQEAVHIVKDMVSMNIRMQNKKH